MIYQIGTEREYQTERCDEDEQEPPSVPLHHAVEAQRDDQQADEVAVPHEPPVLREIHQSAVEQVLGKRGDKVERHERGHLRGIILTERIDYVQMQFRPEIESEERDRHQRIQSRRPGERAIRSQATCAPDPALAPIPAIENNRRQQQRLIDEHIQREVYLRPSQQRHGEEPAPGTALHRLPEQACGGERYEVEINDAVVDMGEEHIGTGKGVSGEQRAGQRRHELFREPVRGERGKGENKCQIEIVGPKIVKPDGLAQQKKGRAPGRGLAVGEYLRHRVHRHADGRIE